MFLLSSETHVAEGSQALVRAAADGDLKAVKHHSRVVRGQCRQLLELVTSDMRDHPSDYQDERREDVSIAIHQLRGVGQFLNSLLVRKRELTCV